MIQLLSDPLIDLNELDQFLVQNLLLLLELHNLPIQLLQSVLQVALVLQNGHLVLLFDGQLHLAHLQGFLELVALRLQVLPPLFLLPPGLVTLIQIASQVLNLLLLLPEDLSELVCRMLHVLQHVGQLVH